MSGRVDVLARLDELDADFLWLVYHDYSGLGRAKAVTRDRLIDAVEHGVTWAKANWNIAINDHLIPDPGFAADSGDFIARPDPGTLVPVPYRQRVAQVLTDLVDDAGLPWDGDPRGQLRSQVRALAEVGLEARVAFETEFTIVRPTDDGWVPGDRGRMFTVDELEARWPWSVRLLDALAGMGIPVHQFAREYGNGQFELSLLPADPITAADRFALSRQAIKALARDDGLVATFMPKPFADLPGNGLHVHISLWHLSDDADATADRAHDSGLSDVGRAAIAGLLAHGRAQAALGAPTANSYKRLLPGSWAPAHVCWAAGNRAALVRIPGRGAARRLEYRAGDASASPYLHLAGLLAAIVDGISGGLEPPPAVEGDVGHMTDADAASRGAARLPTSLREALDALDEDEVLRTMLGPTIDEHYRAVKRYELACADEAGAVEPATEVTEWERQTYLEPL
jgi:glutamine synthetase